MYIVPEHVGRTEMMAFPFNCSKAELPAWGAALLEEMHGRLRGDVLWHVPLAEYTTFRVGGPAEALFFPKGSDDLVHLVNCLNRMSIPWVILGRGSNVLIADEGLKGAVIVLGRHFGGLELLEETSRGVLARAEAGCSLAKLVSWSVEHGFAGLEFAAGIPGSVGGAIVMNAGAWQSEMKNVLARVIMMDAKGSIICRENELMHFAYRSWGESADKVALAGIFRLQKDNPAKLREICREYRERRKSRQPVHMPSAGSFFKNPQGGRTAGELIDQAGMKGCRVGDAMVSLMHANFIVNAGGATARDIIELMKLVQKAVYEKYRVNLEPEVKILGQG